MNKNLENFFKQVINANENLKRLQQEERSLREQQKTVATEINQKVTEVLKQNQVYNELSETIAFIKDKQKILEATYRKWLMTDDWDWESETFDPETEKLVGPIQQKLTQTLVASEHILNKLYHDNRDQLNQEEKDLDKKLSAKQESIKLVNANRMKKYQDMLNEIKTSEETKRLKRLLENIKQIMEEITERRVQIFLTPYYDDENINLELNVCYDLEINKLTEDMRYDPEDIKRIITYDIENLVEEQIFSFKEEMKEKGIEYFNFNYNLDPITVDGDRYINEYEEECYDGEVSASTCVDIKITIKEVK